MTNRRDVLVGIASLPACAVLPATTPAADALAPASETRLLHLEAHLEAYEYAECVRAQLRAISNGLGLSYEDMTGGQRSV